MSDEDDIHEPEHDHLLDNDYLEDERDEDTFGALDEPDACGTGRRRSCEYCDAVRCQSIARFLYLRRLRRAGGLALVRR